MSVSNRGAHLLGLLAAACAPSFATCDEEFVPRDDDVIIAQMSRSEMVRLRMRAWALFEEVRAAGLPPRDGWFSERDAFGDITCNGTPTREPRYATDHDESEQPHSKADMAALEPDDLYEVTFFNRQACLDIHARDFPLNDRRTTDRLLALQRGAIDEFSLGARVIKTFWRPLPKDSPVYVGVWQWPTEPTIDRQTPASRNEWKLETIHEPAGGAEGPRGNWIRRVCVQLDPPPGSACLKAEDYFPVARVDNAAGFPHVRDEIQTPLPDGEALILLAVHIAAKESPDWLWATFWWKGVDRTSGESWTCDDAQRAAVPGPWGNFSANVTKSFKLARPDVDSNDIARCGVPGRIGSDNHKEELLATYNPFVEGVMDNGRKSSCIVCHARAHTRGDVGVARFLIPEVGEVEWPPVTHFEGHIRTDYLWTVPDYIGYSDEPEPERD